MPFYTKAGDGGETFALGKSVPKTDSIICALAKLDLLNSNTGLVLALCHVRDESIKAGLEGVQNDLFKIGSLMSGFGDAGLLDDSVGRLEACMDEMEKVVPEPKQFVNPGGCVGAAQLHVLRAMAREAELSVLEAAKSHKIDENVKKYLNRLSSYLFAAALYLNRAEDVEELHPVLGSLRRQGSSTAPSGEGTGPSSWSRPS
jgi:cob(I)alamin adenosyltransferase